MANEQTIITAEGLEKLKVELEERQTVKRAEIIARIEEARAQGDLSENSEYDQARDDQAMNEGRIKTLEYMIKTATVIEAPAKADTVGLGSTVVLLDKEFDEQETYSIVGTAEADPFENRISNESPVGAAIMNHKVGDEVVVLTPSGELVYKILEVK